MATKGQITLGSIGPGALAFPMIQRIQSDAVFSELSFSLPYFLTAQLPRGGTPYFYMRGSCQYLGSEIFAKAIILGSVKNSFKQINIWGLRITA